MEQELTRINVYKAPGPDGIPNGFLRDFAPLLSVLLCAIYNKTYRNAPERRSGSFFGQPERRSGSFFTRIHPSNAFENVILTLAFRVHGSKNS